MATAAADTVKILAKCRLGEDWFQHKDGGTYWHGFEGQLLKSFPIPKYELVREVPPANWSIGAIQAIVNGKIHMDSDVRAITLQRYQHIDYSSQMYSADVKIISVKSVDFKSRVFEGVFDLPTYIAIVMVILLLALLTLIFKLSQEKNSSFSLVDSFVSVFGSILGEQSKSCLNLGHFSSQILFSMVCIFSLFIGLMYNSVIISVLTSGRKEQVLDSFEALVKHPDIKIYIWRKGAPFGLEQSTPLYSKLEPRFIDSGGPPLEEIYQNIHSGTHISITYEEVFNGDYNRMTQSFRCQYRKDNLRFARVLPGIKVAWIFKKGFKYAEAINRKILQFREFGILYNFQTDMTTHMRNVEKDGLFIPVKQHGRCPKRKGKFTWHFS